MKGKKKNRKASGESTRVCQSFYTFSCRVFSPTELEESSGVYIKTALRGVGAPRRAEGEESDSILPALEWQVNTEGCFS